MGRQSKISKQKGVQLVADDMFFGADRKTIVQKFTKKYSLSVSAVDKWIKAAQGIVQERREAEEIQKRALIKQTTEEVVKELGLSLKEVLSEYKKVAFFDIRKIYTVNGGLKSIYELDDSSAGAIAGVESLDERQKETGQLLGTTQKVKIVNKVSALDSISKILGYNAPEKVAQTDTDGNDLPIVTFFKLPENGR